MKCVTNRILIATAFVAVVGCASNTRFVKSDPDFMIKSKPAEASIVFSREKLSRAHKVVGVIHAELGREARIPELDALLIKKAREIGADGVMLVEYDKDREVYLEQHHAVVGRGPYRRHVVGTRPRAVVKKTASGLAVVFQ